MTFFFEEDEGNTVLHLDHEAIIYLIEGLVQLRDMAPRETLSTPLISEDGVAELILMRVPDGVVG